MIYILIRFGPFSVPQHVNVFRTQAEAEAVAKSWLFGHQPRWFELDLGDRDGLAHDSGGRSVALCGRRLS